MLFTSSVGPFNGGALKTAIAKKGLSLFDILTVRDTITYDDFLKLGFKEAVLLPDSAYVIEPVSSKKVQEIFRIEDIPCVPGEMICVGVSILLYNRMKNAGEDYLSVMKALVEKTKSMTGKPIILLPHQLYTKRSRELFHFSDEQLNGEWGEDRIVSKKIYDALTDKSGVYSLDGEYTADEYKGIIKDTEIFVGGRMHTVIGATSVHVPSAIIEYSHKAPGLMKFLGVQEYRWSINDSPEKLLQMIEKLWNNRNQYKRMLDDKIPGMIKDAYSAADLLAEKLAGLR